MEIDFLAEFKRLKHAATGNLIFIEIDSWLGGGVWVLLEKDTPIDKVNEIAQSQYDHYKAHINDYMRFKNEHTYSH